MPELIEMEEQPEAPVRSSTALGKLLMIMILALVSSAVGGVVSWVLISRTMGGASASNGSLSEQAERQRIAEMIEKSAVLPLEPFVVNLADVDAARYLRIKISLLVDDERKMAEVVENEALQLKVRDVILQSLTAKTSQDLIHESGKNKLRQEIQEKVAVYFGGAKLVDVMFSEFVIQL